MNQNNSLLLES